MNDKKNNPGLAVFLIMLARSLLTEAPQIIDWLSELKQKKITNVTEEHYAKLEAKWDIPGESFFE